MSKSEKMTTVVLVRYKSFPELLLFFYKQHKVHCEIKIYIYNLTEHCKVTFAKVHCIPD